MKLDSLHLAPWLAPVLLAATASPGGAAEIAVDEDASLLAVITHKGGLAAGKAHNHLVSAGAYRAELDFDPADPLGATFELELEAGDLVIDRWDLQQARYPRFEELGVLDEPWTELDESTRDKIRDAMLGKKQLDARQFPKITARLTAVRAKSSTAGQVAFDHQVTLAFEVHGRTVERAVAARYEVADDRITLEAVGSFLFSDFGIKPYSAAFGLVKNLDAFHVYLYIEGEPPADTSGS